MPQTEAHRLEMSRPFSMRTTSIGNFEELECLVTGAQTEVTQIEGGRLQGSLSHAMIAGMPLDFCSFSLGLRSRGMVSEDLITIGILTGHTDRVTHWSYQLQAGDVLVLPPGAERNARYHGGAALAVISLAVSDLDSIFGSEPLLREPGSWIRSHYRRPDYAGTVAILSLQEIIARLQAGGASLGADAAEFWKYAIIEVMTTTILENLPSDTHGPAPSARHIVGKFEDYIEINEARSVHISEICSRLGVSRRTLHRAFHEALGVGPSAFLRRRRLCSVHKNLRRGNPMITTVAEVALHHGFANLGRFSGEYHRLFGEYPSQTLGARIDDRRRQEPAL